jgi:hypothetical protein
MAKRIVKVLAAGLAGAGAGLAALMIPGLRMKPEERERRRRLHVNAHGRMGSATIRDFQDGVVCYTYEIRGAVYTATQDVSALAEFLPEDPARLIERPAALKYLPDNPANSIVLCELWTGLRFRPPGIASELSDRERPDQLTLH